MTAHRLFVYGTLMAGEPNARQMAGARFLGPAATLAVFDLLDCSNLADYGVFPGLRPGGRTSVRGELYLVDDELLARLDAFEGHPLLFARTPIGLAGGAVAEAYLIAPGRFPAATLIPTGDWRRFRAHKLARPRGLG